MTPKEERVYMQGESMAASHIMQTCLRFLNPRARTKESWVLERTAAIALLRRLCEDYGDNDWDDDLFLADIIENHLYLEPVDAQPKPKPKKATKRRSVLVDATVGVLYCTHANESPNECPCPAGCYCRTHGNCPHTER